MESGLVKENSFAYDLNTVQPVVFNEMGAGIRKPQINQHVRDY